MTYTFQTNDMLYYILDYTAGGDLQTLTKDNHLLETEARFYTAEIILGLEHIHKYSIVYRDLKVGRGPSWIVSGSIVRGTGEFS
ncbi:RAC family serine/threonine-protein kinase homolog [Rhincodon typus]|uniref:RAC family serine/threonine-protein kinase homolog n=1 Tax=Rhincodon typus TaxID=259920 RepID=UPI00202F1576|nr:RAC family serine/threonine-protein kinase homolog [Rhincodon typus]